MLHFQPISDYLVLQNMDPSLLYQKEARKPCFLELLLPLSSQVSVLADKSQTGIRYLIIISYACLYIFFLVYYQAYAKQYFLIAYPAWIFKVTFFPLVVNTNIGMLLFILYPLLNLFAALFLLYNALKTLIILAHCCFVTIYSALQLNDSTNLFTFTINHCKWFRDFTNLKTFNSFCNLLRHLRSEEHTSEL